VHKYKSIEETLHDHVGDQKLPYTPLLYDDKSFLLLERSSLQGL
jgi:hypothetical protein